MSGHRRRKGGHAEEHHVDERWLVSYADMITVLMALFIVLYAMSTVDAHKYDQLKTSLASGFGQTKTAKVDENATIVPKKFVKKHGAGLSATTLTADAVAAEIKKALADAGESAKAQVSKDGTSVTVSLVGSSAYFDGNQAALRPEALAVLEAVGPTLKPKDLPITVEGHADPHGSSGSFGTDWSLAGERANSVLVWLVDNQDVNPKKITSISYGSEHAVDPTAATAVGKNRRVDIVVHLPKPAAPAAAPTPAATAAAAGAAGGKAAEAAEKPAGH